MYLPGLKNLRDVLTSEEGSISVLIIGLFSILLSTTLILTDISTVYLAKRTLSLASEAAVQRGGKNLDQGAYYQGEYNLNEALRGALGDGVTDPGIPIDCEKGLRDAQETLKTWQGRDLKSSRRSMSAISLANFQCDGFEIYLESTATVTLPFPIPFIRLREVQIHTFAGGLNERSESNNYYGLDIG
jgi:hypothetical protein